MRNTFIQNFTSLPSCIYIIYLRLENNISVRALLLLPLQLLILNIRLWVTDRLFSGNRKTMFVSLFVWSLCAVGLFMYGHLLSASWLWHIDFSNMQEYPKTILLWWITFYVLCIVGINNGISWLRTTHTTPRHTRLYVQEICIWALILSIAYIGLWYISIAPIIIYYLFVSASEEWLKYLSSFWLFKKQWFSSSDLVIYSILVSLWFAFLENIIYMIQYTASIQNIQTQLTSGSGILISRWLIWFLVHMLFTGTIAFWTVQYIQRKWIYRLPLALIWGIVLHVIYNTMLHYGITIIVPIYIIMGYFFLSWILYRSDGMYLNK